MDPRTTNGATGSRPARPAGEAHIPQRDDLLRHVTILIALVETKPCRQSREKRDAAHALGQDRVSGLHWRVYDPVSGAQKRMLKVLFLSL